MPRSSPLLRKVAASLASPPALIPHLPELFADLSALGSTPRTITRLLRESGLPENAAVLDLACGKGAVAVAVAQELGARVLGLDAYEPFLESARDLARKRGVSQRCTFRAFDLHDPATLPRGRRFDAAMMIGLDPLDRAAPVLRRLTRRGGVYLVDDIFRDVRHPHARRYADIPDRAESAAVFAALGDAVEAVHVPTPSAVRQHHGVIYRALARRAGFIRREHPRLAKPLREFLASQRFAGRLLGGPLRPAVWVVRRG